MIINEIISNVQSYFNSGVKSDDYTLSDRLIYSEALALRSALLYDKIKKLKGFYISDNNFNVINCIKLVEVDAANCPCIPVKGCVVKRSKYQLPTLLATTYGDYIEYVRTIDGGSKFDKSNLSEQESKQYREYGKLANEFFLENRYLWIYTTKQFEDLQYVRMKAIFEDLLEVNDFMVLNDCVDVRNDIKCTAYDIEFKIDKELVKILTEMLITNIYKYFLINVQDTRNNAKHDTTQQRQPSSSTSKKDNDD